MTRKSATKAFFNILKNIGLVVLPIGTVSGIVEYLFKNRIYSIFSVLFTAIILYIIWLELRLRKIEDGKNG